MRCIACAGVGASADGRGPAGGGGDLYPRGHCLEEKEAEDQLKTIEGEEISQGSLPLRVGGEMGGPVVNVDGRRPRHELTEAGQTNEEAQRVL